MLEVAEVGRRDDPLDESGPQHVALVDVIAGLVHALADHLHADSHLQRLHGALGVQGVEFKVVEAQDRKAIALLSDVHAVHLRFVAIMLRHYDVILFNK